MEDTVHVTGIVGSLREDSVTRTAVTQALEAAEATGADTRLIDLREYNLPTFDPDVDREDAGDAEQLAREVRQADSIVLGTPMYHGSYSSVLKTALDYCGFDEFEDKTVGLIAVSGGGYPLPALEHLRSVCRAFNAWVLPYQTAIPDSHSAVDDNEFTDEDLATRVEELGNRVVRYANIEPSSPSFESEENVGAE